METPESEMTDAELLEMLIEQDPDMIDKWLADSAATGGELDLLSCFCRDVNRVVEEG